ADQPISSALAADLAPWLLGMAPRSIVFPLHHETARALKADLKRAGIAYETDDGVADFHSLRAYFISALVRSGASIATVRDLARHAKAETTLKHYAKTELMDLRGAVESLPAAIKIGPKKLAATGTDPDPIATEIATEAPTQCPKVIPCKEDMSTHGRFA